jgi:predicted amidohydrolase YtcJ
MRLEALRMPLIAAVAALSAGAAIADEWHGPGKQPDRCKGSRDVAIVNGRISTMDERRPVVSSLTIKDGRIASVGNRGDRSRGPCTKVIDVHGRRVIPGLIDNHNHIVQAGHRPGHDNRLDNAFSIADVQNVIRARTDDVPEGEWINAIGGWNTGQFAERRLPTLAELDAVAPSHPVFLQAGFAGPSATNSVGKSILEEKAGVTVAENGQVGQTALAVAYLRSLQTPADTRRGVVDVTSWAAGLGLTTSVDQGANINTSPRPFKPFLEVADQDRLPIRLRITFSSSDTTPELPQLRARLDNAFIGFGNDMVRTIGLGEGISQSLNPPYAQAALLVAQEGYMHTQHLLDLASTQRTTDVWEEVNETVPLRDLHWSLQHVPVIDAATIERLKAMGVGIAAHGFRVLGGTPTSNGPQFRTLIDSGIHVGGGSDGANIAPINPWMHIYYMVTGKNNAGVLINEGQTISRAEALRLYTAENGWFLDEEDDLGSLEIGKLGDVAVLSRDFLDPRKVSDEGIRSVSSVLTVVGGKVVHDTGVVH